MEILKRKRWVDIVKYCFSFIKHQNSFFHLAKKAKKCIYIYIPFQCFLGGHGNHSGKLFGNHNCWYDIHWSLTGHYFKCCTEVSIIEQNLNKYFLIIWNWFVDTKLNIHFARQNKMHTIWHLKKLKPVVFIWDLMQIKQYYTVTYIDCAMMKIFLEKLWLWKLLAKLTVDFGFCTGKIDFCCNIIVDYFVKL